MSDTAAGYEGERGDEKLLAGDLPNGDLGALQFGLGHLLILTGFTSVLLAIVFVTPGWVACSVIAVCNLLAAVFAMCGIVYLRSKLQAFCIGATVAMFPTWVFFTCLFVVITFESFNDDYGEIFDELADAASGAIVCMAYEMLAIPAAGFMAVSLRSLFRKSETND